jgi:hypothetical protein
MNLRFQSTETALARITATSGLRSMSGDVSPDTGQPVNLRFAERKRQQPAHPSIKS